MRIRSGKAIALRLRSISHRDIRHCGQTEAQVKQTVSIKALTLEVVYQSEPQPVAEHFRPLVEDGS